MGSANPTRIRLSRYAREWEPTPFTFEASRVVTHGNRRPRPSWVGGVPKVHCWVSFLLGSPLHGHLPTISQALLVLGVLGHEVGVSRLVDGLFPSAVWRCLLF